MGSRNRSLKQRTLDHYGRMKRWAEKQNNDLVSRTMMRDAIGEDWGNKCCPYCIEQDSLNLDCASCALRGYPYAGDCCDGAWFEMHTSETWSEWIKKCDKVIEYIKEHG